VRVVVAIPWRPTPERAAGFECTRARWLELLGPVPILELDTDHHPFNLNAARNLGVRMAAELDADVVVVSDADAVLADDVNVPSVLAAVAGGLHLPYTAQRYLTPRETAAVLAGDTRPLGGHHGNGACYVTRPDAWWSWGGGDERFSGWGGDDDQIVAAATCLSRLERHHGTVLSLHHADERRPVGTEEHRPNAELARRYWSRIRNPVGMRRLIAERRS
jgi:glycosyltransferase involved in cell wall biosynthesis